MLMHLSRHGIPVTPNGRAILHVVHDNMTSARADHRHASRRFSALTLVAIFGLGAVLGWLTGLLSGLIVADNPPNLRWWEERLDQKLTEKFTREDEDDH